MLDETQLTKHVAFQRPAWLGDSITANNGLASVHYHDILAANWHAERSDNLGISGSTVGSRYDAMAARYQSIPADADFIAIFGGVNDYGRNQPLGQYGDTTITTFYGALTVLLTGLQTTWPTVPKLFISAIHIGSDFGGSFSATTNALGYRQADYEAAIEQVTADYSVPHLSLYHDAGITFAIPAQAAIYSVDTLHPNNAGHQVIARKVQAFLDSHF